MWIYKGPSKGAANTAYWRACKKEIERVRGWGVRTAWRKSNIIRLLNECIEDIPITSEMSSKQKAAIQQLLKLSKEDIACHREFYEHIVEERRRREEDSIIRRKMRERKIN